MSDHVRIAAGITRSFACLLDANLSTSRKMSQTQNAWIRYHESHLVIRIVICWSGVHHVRSA